MRPRIAALGLLLLAGPAHAEESPTLLVVVGAAGTPAYASRFRETAARWQRAGERAQAAVTTIGLEDARAPGKAADRARLEAALADAKGKAAPLWLIFIGHGTFDGRAARFNLRGPDVSASDLSAWCKPLSRPLIFVDGASASGPFLPALAGPSRVVVTAAKSGAETNPPRFGELFADAITGAAAGSAADLDRDGGVTVLEAFLHASKAVEGSFQAEGLLATEHALLDDNGDGRGTPASSLRGLDADGAGAARDGARAAEIALFPAPAERALPPALKQKRDQLERALASLRQQRAKIGEAAYFQRAERLLLDLARVYQQAGRLP